MLCRALILIVPLFYHGFLKYASFGQCSPHIQTIRERISLGRLGEPVSAKALNDIFHRSKKIINQARELENERISHFEVYNGSVRIC